MQVCRTNSGPCPPISSCNLCLTLADIETNLSANSSDGLIDEPTLYRSLARALQYLTFTRPDIPYGVQQICLFMHVPPLKLILCYVCGNLTHALHMYTIPDMSLILYYDADWSGCPNTHNSTSRYYVFFGINLISWSSKR